MAGAKKGTSAAAKRRCQELVGVTATPQGAACRRGRGTKKRIDSKLRRLKCLRPVRAAGHAKEGNRDEAQVSVLKNGHEQGDSERVFPVW